MKNLPIVLLGALAAPAALAQSPIRAETATDYAVFATDGTDTAFDAEAIATPILRGLHVRASVGGGRMSPPTAWASTQVSPFSPRPGELGLRIVEAGGVASADPQASHAAGTSADAPNTSAPTQGAHSIALGFAVPPGRQGTVTIAWDGQASPGARLGAAVDVDGDGTADWTGAAGSRDLQRIPVTAGPNGVELTITTDGSAAVAGLGRAGYHGGLSVTFIGGGGGPSCTWTSSGRQCLGALTGTDSVTSRGITLTLDVAGAAQNGLGVLVVGDLASTPFDLPRSNCQLLVDPTPTRLLHAFVTDATGAARMVFRIPVRPVTTNFQAVTIELANSGAIGSTDVLGLVCQ